MISRNWQRGLLGVVALGLLVPSVRAADNKPDDSYHKLLDQRAEKALKDNDVQALVECAFALYPVETAGKVKNPKYQELIARAADVVLAKKDAKEAGQFLETAGPLLGGLKAEQRAKLETLFRGQSIDDLAGKEAAVARGSTKKVGMGLADPEAKPRGDDVKEAAEGLGLSLVKTVRYADTPILKTYSLKGARLKVTMEWAGVVTGNKYTSDIEFEFEQVGGKVLIKSILYSDDALTKWDPYYVEKFRREFNAKQ
jgi:hypothetical protein